MHFTLGCDPTIEFNYNYCKIHVQCSKLNHNYSSGKSFCDCKNCPFVGSLQNKGNKFYFTKACEQYNMYTPSLRSKRFHRVCAKGFPYVRLSFPLFGCAKVEASKKMERRGEGKGGEGNACRQTPRF